MNYFDDEKEWKWLFDHGLDWDTLMKLYNPEFPTPDGMNNKEEVIGFLKEILTATGEWTGTRVTERAEELDKIGAGEIKDGNTYPSAPLQANYDEAKELAMIGLCQEPEFGGMNAPQSIGMIVLAQLSRAVLPQVLKWPFIHLLLIWFTGFVIIKLQKELFPKSFQEISQALCVLLSLVAGLTLGHSNKSKTGWRKRRRPKIYS